MLLSSIERNMGKDKGDVLQGTLDMLV